MLMYLQIFKKVQPVYNRMTPIQNYNEQQRCTGKTFKNKSNSNKLLDGWLNGIISLDDMQ